MKKLWNKVKDILPPPGWRVAVLFAVAVLCGLTLYIIYISRALSYLSDSPNACMNCHIMAPEYITWSRSAHQKVAVCNDCHVPQDNIVNKYFFKAKDGLRHSTIFTMRTEPQTIKMHEAGQEVVQGNCKRCHGDYLSQTHLPYNYANEIERRCWDCHRETPHGDVKGLSSVPNARVPTTPSMVPNWIKKITGERQERRP